LTGEHETYIRSVFYMTQKYAFGDYSKV